MKYRDQLLTDQEARILYVSLPEGPDTESASCDNDTIDRLLAEGFLETTHTVGGVQWNQTTADGREILLRYRRDESIFKQCFAAALGVWDE